MAVKAHIHEAKTDFSELLERAHRVEEVIIAKAGRPCARLVPVRPAGTRRPGEFRGQIHADVLGGTGPDDSSWG